MIIINREIYVRYSKVEISFSITNVKSQSDTLSEYCCDYKSTVQKVKINLLFYQSVTRWLSLPSFRSHKHRRMTSTWMWRGKCTDLLNSLLHADVVAKSKETMAMKSSLIGSFLRSLDSLLDNRAQLHIVELIDWNLTQLLLKLNRERKRSVKKEKWGRDELGKWIAPLVRAENVVNGAPARATIGEP